MIIHFRPRSVGLYVRRLATAAQVASLMYSVIIIYEQSIKSLKKFQWL